MKHFRLDAAANQILDQMGIRLDSAQTALFLRDLTYVYQETYDIKYATAKARLILPLDTRVPSGADSFVWRQYDRVGVAKFGDMGADDAPNGELFGSEFQGRCTSVLMSYQYTLQDIRAAAMGQLSLESRKAAIARKMWENAVEAVAVQGDAAASFKDSAAFFGMVGTGAGSSTDPIRMFGFANAPNIINAAVADATVLYPGVASLSVSGLQTATNWTLGSTPVAAIVADVLKLQQAIFMKSVGVHTPNLMLWPTAPWAILNAAARSSTFTSDTILEYIKDLMPEMTHMHWPALDTAGLKQDNATAGPRVMCCEKNSENFSLVIPQEFEQLPPQQVNYAFKIPCHGRLGGVKMPYPKSVCYLDGTAG